jgi:hypothetical protein
MPGFVEGELSLKTTVVLLNFPPFLRFFFCPKPDAPALPPHSPRAMEVFKKKYQRFCDENHEAPVRGVSLALEGGSRVLRLDGELVNPAACRVLCRTLSHDTHFTELSLVDVLLGGEF